MKVALIYVAVVFAIASADRAMVSGMLTKLTQYAHAEPNPYD